MRSLWLLMLLLLVEGLKSDPKIHRCQGLKFGSAMILCPKLISNVCGITSSEEFQDFSNSCWACANENVQFWIQGKCDEELKQLILQQGSLQELKQHIFQQKSAKSPKLSIGG